MPVIYNDELYHHGVKGQKWGVRRYQNADGTLTPLGKKKKQKFIDYAEKRARKDQEVYAKSIDRARRMQNNMLETRFETLKVVHRDSANRMMRNLQKASYEEIRGLGKTRRQRYEKAIEQGYREAYLD